MVVVQSLAIAISIFVSFLASDVHSQEPGTLIIAKSYKNSITKKTESTLILHACQCYMASDASELLLFDDTGKFWSCKIISKQESTVSLIVYQPRRDNSKRSNGRNISCSLKTVKEMRSGLYSKSLELQPSEKPNCILTTDMIIEQPTNLFPVLFYSSLLITLVMATLYAAYNYDLWTKLKARLRLSQDWDRVPLSVNFQP